MHILKFIPREIACVIEENLHGQADYEKIEEMRFRVNKPIILRLSEKEIIIPYIIKQEELLKILQIICDNSIYTYQNEICNGFVTVEGGHRIGITGEAVYENGKVKNIKYISSLNFRIARQIEGASNEIIEKILDKENNSVYNTLIVGPPGSGKTTILKDLIKKISNGIKECNFLGLTVGVADERGELSATSKGIPSNDLGIRTDVINNLKKSIAIEMIVRSMSPQVIVSDEIGNREDIQAINYALCSGVKCIFTAHGKDYETLKSNPIFKEMIEAKLFEKIIFLPKRR